MAIHAQVANDGSLRKFLLPMGHQSSEGNKEVMED